MKTSGPGLLTRHLVILGALAWVLVAEAGTNPTITATETSGSNGIRASDRALVASEGGEVVFEVTAAWPDTGAFQWVKDGAFLPGATNRSLRLEKVERADEGSYSVMARAGSGPQASEPIRLLVSNVQPEAYLALRVIAATNGPLPIWYSDTVEPGASWVPLRGTTSSVAPLVILDPISRNQTRFYRTDPGQKLSASVTAVWQYHSPAGSTHAIEYVDEDASTHGWTLQEKITTPSSPFVYAGTGMSGPSGRRYRTTLVSSPAGRRFGKLVASAGWKLPERLIDSLTPDDLQAVAALGLSFEAGTGVLRYPTNVLAGYWVSVGDQRVMTDTNGVFAVDVDGAVARGYALKSPDSRSAEAEAVFDPRKLSPEPMTPTPIVARYYREGVLAMGPTVSTSRARPAGPPNPLDPRCGDPCRDGSCCLDYDGSVNDGCRYPDLEEADPASAEVAEALWKKWRRYVGSTCNRLVNAGLCTRELNAVPTDPDTGLPTGIPPILGNINCRANHKYRYCQTCQKGDLTVSAEATEMLSGASVRVVVHNNSWANETILALEAPSDGEVGTVAGDLVFENGSASRYLVRHYRDLTETHVKDVELTYTAPVLTAGIPRQITLRVMADGVSRSILFRICSGAGQDAGVRTIVSVGTSGSGGGAVQFAGFDPGVSVNDSGMIAFIGRVRGGDGQVRQNLFSYDTAASVLRTLGNRLFELPETGSSPRQTFGPGVQIRNDGRVLARRFLTARVFSPPTIPFVSILEAPLTYLETWDGYTQGQVHSAQVFMGNGGVSPLLYLVAAPLWAGWSTWGNDWAADLINLPSPIDRATELAGIQGRVTGNNVGGYFFGALNGDGDNLATITAQGKWIVRLVSERPAPQMADDGNTVFRLGPAATGRIVVVPPSFFPFTANITEAGKYGSLGYMPGISDDGSAVAYTGDGGHGESLYVSVRSKGGFQPPVVLLGNSRNRRFDPGEVGDTNGNGVVDAGETETGGVTRFDLNSRVGVQCEPEGERCRLHIAVVAYDEADAKTLYLIEAVVGGAEVTEVRSRKALTTGASLGGCVGIVEDVVLSDPVNRTGRVAAWVRTDGGEAIVTVEPGTVAGSFDTEP